jgi:hypothetical protein
MGNLFSFQAVGRLISLLVGMFPGRSGYENSSLSNQRALNLS